MKSTPPKKNRRPAPPKSRPAPAGAAPQASSTDALNHLQATLSEVQATLDALRGRAADAGSAGGDHDDVSRAMDPGQPCRVYIERMQEGAVTVSAEGVVLFCNPRFAEMLGQPLDRVINSNLSKCLTPESWNRIAGVFAGQADVVKCETTLRRDADSGLPVMLTASRLSPENRAIMCVVVTDLTAQKEQEDLRRAKEVAERSSAAKDDFLAALSHELRTPLTPALMAATVLEKDTSLPETARSDISLIRRNIELEARLIDDLLDLTLITHGKFSLQTDEINLHTCLNRAIEICQGDARLKRLNMQIELNARKTLITGDAVRVQQVCWNILRNAVKFTAERGTIAIITGNDDHNNVWVRITDTGIGFTHDRAARIFDPFERGDRHHARQFGGLGLSLAITRSIMHAHGGGIEAQSAGLNQGASFTLRFPLARAAKAKPGKTTPRAPAETSGLNILLVEDHKDTRVCIQRLLEASAHRVTSAGTAQDALGLAENSQFDLVISDLGLPDLSGHELMERLHTRFNLPGIALSGYGMETDLAHSRAAGFKYHLTKPVSFDRLKNFIAEFAAKREPVSEVSSATP
jgi:PAS domain S-box-containing protein